MEFKEIEPNEMGILTHVYTGKQLTASIDPNFLLSSDFGVENSVVCFPQRVLLQEEYPRSVFKFVIKA
jgi:hypothetical protein